MSRIGILLAGLAGCAHVLGAPLQLCDDYAKARASALNTAGFGLEGTGVMATPLGIVIGARFVNADGLMKIDAMVDTEEQLADAIKSGLKAAGQCSRGSNTWTIVRLDIDLTKVPKSPLEAGAPE